MTGQVTICNKGTYTIQVTRWASFNFTGRGTSPGPKNSQSTSGSRPQHQHWCPTVSFGEGVVIAMGAVAIAMGAVGASIAIAERDGAHITGQSRKQPPWGNWQDVNIFLRMKGLVDYLQCTLCDQRLCFTTTGILLLHINIYYYTLLHTWRL